MLEHCCGNTDKPYVTTKEPSSSPLNKKPVLSTSEEHSKHVSLNTKHMLMISTIRSLFIRNFFQATWLTSTTNGRFCNWGEQVHPKCPQQPNQDSLINHDNVPVNAALRVHQFFATNHPLYSPTLVPRYSFLLPCMKLKLRASFPGSLKSSNNSWLPYTLFQK